MINMKKIQNCVAYLAKSINVLFKLIKGLFKLISFTNVSGERPTLIGKIFTLISIGVLLLIGTIYFVNPQGPDWIFWIDLFSGVLGLAGAVRISEGVYLGADGLKKLLHPQQVAEEETGQKNLSEAKVDHILLRNMANMIVQASDLCLSGTAILVWTFVLQLAKFAIH